MTDQPTNHRDTADLLRQVKNEGAGSELILSADTADQYLRWCGMLGGQANTTEPRSGHLYTSFSTPPAATGTRKRSFVTVGISKEKYDATVNDPRPDHSRREATYVRSTAGLYRRETDDRTKARGFDSGSHGQDGRAAD